MKRKALLKDGDKFVMLEESDFRAETALQEALKRNSEVIPVADLELNEVIVVGRETTLPVGAIDLLLVDADGRIIILETKLSRNPELRRQVIAQLSEIHPLSHRANTLTSFTWIRRQNNKLTMHWRLCGVRSKKDGHSDQREQINLKGMRAT